MNDELPEAPKAAGNYVTVKKIGDFIYTSGHVPITDEKKIIGKIPNEISIEEGYDAASLCAELTIASLLTISDIKKFPKSFQNIAAKADEYMRGNLLLNEVRAEDVAKAFFHLSVSKKTTGAVLTVDGGNIAASLR